MKGLLYRALLLALCVAMVGCSPIPWSGKDALGAFEDEGEPAVSLAGEAPLAFVYQGDLWLGRADGSEPVRLTGEGGVWYPRVSPDGDTVAYVLAPADETETAGLWALDLETGLSRLLAGAEGSWSAPAWSPESTRLAWSAGEALLVLDAETGDVVRTWEDAPLDPTHYAPLWSADGATLYAARYTEDTLALDGLPLEGDARSLYPLDPSLPWAMAAAPQGGVTLWQAGQLLTLDADAIAPAALAPAEAEAPVALAWSPTGDELALVDAAGALWVGTLWEWPAEATYASAGLSDLAWLAEDTLALWQETIGGHSETLLTLALPAAEPTVLSVMPVTSVAPLAAEYGDLPVAATALGAQAAARSYDYYRYQGEWDSGAVASSNCGPTAVAMAIQFARNNLWVNISDIRSYIGGSSWTYQSQLASALTHWQVSNQALHSMGDVDAALARGSLVLAHVWMVHITPGADYFASYSSPTTNTGRYYSYSQSHWLLLKGTSADGTWIIAHDPNVWNGNGVYWYSGSLAKGRDRYYRYSEVAAAIAAYNYELIEVPADGAAPTPTATPAGAATAAPTAQPTSGVWHTVVAGQTLSGIARQYGTTVSAIVAANGISNPNLIYIGQVLWIPQSSVPTPTATNTPEVTASLVPTSTAVPPTATAVPPTATLVPPVASATPVPPTATPTQTASAPAETPTLTPTAAATASAGIWYTVTWGDTLGGIAARYGLTTQALAAANSITNPNLIRIGQRLWIPLAGVPAPIVTAGATPTPTGTAGAVRYHTVKRGESLSTIAVQYGITWQALAQANGLSAWSIIYVGQQLIIP